MDLAQVATHVAEIPSWTGYVLDLEVLDPPPDMKPRAAVMRSEIMNHLVHHRAQLGVYLRLNDVAIPGMYGPSADEKAVAAGQAA